MNTTGDRIRELRLRQHLTLDDVAKYLGVGRQAVYKYEQGYVTNIPLENIEKMAVLFGTTPGYIAGWNSSNISDPSAEEFPSLLPDEKKLIKSYRSLSPRGQDLLNVRAEELKVLYGKKSPDSSVKSV